MSIQETLNEVGVFLKQLNGESESLLAGKRSSGARARKLAQQIASSMKVLRVQLLNHTKSIEPKKRPSPAVDQDKKRPPVVETEERLVDKPKLKLKPKSKKA